MFAIRTFTVHEKRLKKFAYFWNLVKNCITRFQTHVVWYQITVFWILDNYCAVDVRKTNVPEPDLSIIRTKGCPDFSTKLDHFTFNTLAFFLFVRFSSIWKSTAFALLKSSSILFFLNIQKITTIWEFLLLINSAKQIIINIFYLN